MDAMECREMFGRLSEFLDGELPADLCQQIQAHMDGCEPCQAFARTLRDTVERCRRLSSRPLPEDVKREIATLLKHLPHQR